MKEQELLPVMAAVHNYFETALFEGSFPVKGGMAETPFSLTEGQYLLIRGAGKENRLLGPGDTLPGPDRMLTARLWLLEPPLDFLDLCGRIARFRREHDPGAPLREQLESYSLQRDERSRVWQIAFREELRPYARMASEVY